MSLGVLFEIPVGGMSYNLEFFELSLLLLVSSICYKSWKENKYIKKSSYFKIPFLFLISLFIYSLLTFYWTSYGLSVIPGAIVFFYGIFSMVVARHYLSDNNDLYTIASRIFVMLIVIQLLTNISSGILDGVSGFYDLKDYARTFIGKSNFISVFISFDLIYEFISKEKHWLIFLVIDTIALIFTISRGAIVSLVLAMGVFVIVALFNKNFKTKSLLLSVGLFFIFGILFMTLTPPGRELLQGLSAGLNANTVGTRQILWVEAFQETLNNPMGVGVVWINDPHNFIFSSLRNFGFIFGFLYILFMASPFFLLIHPIVKGLSVKTVAAIIAYLSVYIHSLIEVFYFTKLSLVWSVITLTFILYLALQDIKIYKKERMLKTNIVSKYKGDYEMESRRI